jgi:hypothetical protein
VIFLIATAWACFAAGLIAGISLVGMAQEDDRVGSCGYAWACALAAVTGLPRRIYERVVTATAPLKDWRLRATQGA